MLAVFVVDDRTRNAVLGYRAASDKMAVGEARFLNAGYAHATKNERAGQLRVVIVEFSDPQGKMERSTIVTHSESGSKANSVPQEFFSVWTDCTV
jgi:hypothetical protein